MKKILSLIIFIAVSFCSCSERFTSHSFFAMDTFISVDAKNADSEVMNELERLVYSDEQRFSRTFSGSEIYEFNKTNDGNVLSDDTILLLENAVKIYYATDGAFSPFLGSLSDLWNIKSENPEVPEKEEIERVLENCRFSDVVIENGKVSKLNSDLIIDLGGIAKGASAKNCIEYLKGQGVTDAVISFGGSIACIGDADNKDDGWVIGIKNPFEVSQIVGSVNVTDCYIAVSGAYERFFEKDGVRYHHIFDPMTGYPANTDIESVAVISDDASLSDALSTALFVMGKEKALDFYSEGLYDFDAVIILTDGNIVVTDGIRDVFTFNGKADFKDGKKLIYNH